MKTDRLPDLGKIHPAFFDRVVFPRLGARDERVIVGPRHGVDFGVVRLGGEVAALSTDPFFIVPQLGFVRAAWFAFHIVVSDVAVSGLVPRYLAVDLNLPPEISESEMEELWISVHDEARRYGIAIVTGHTARYAGCSYPMVGGATAIAVGPERELRAPHLVRSGDAIVVTKGPAIETTGLLAALFPERFAAAGGEAFQREAADLFRWMSVLDDCAVARQFDGVRVMHDATECGVFGGLFEMAAAGGYGMRIDADAIPVPDVVRRTGDLFGFDPFCAISEGTLVAVVDPRQAAPLVSELRREGIPGAVCGEIAPREDGLTLLRGGRREVLAHPKVDPYWKLAADLAG